MGYYRSVKDNTIQVEAIRHDGSRTGLTNIRSLISVTGENNLAQILGGRIFITTREGGTFVPRGSWVVKDATGDIFVSSNADFEDIYEAGVAITSTGASNVGELSQDVTDVADDLAAHMADTANPHSTDHGATGGLSDDDHSQYALLNGRSGDTYKVDDITEYTSDNGVTVEGVSLKDGGITTTGAQFVNSTAVNAATYDLLTTDYILRVTYTSTGAVTSLTLPTAQCVDGRTIIVKDAGGNAAANNITVDTEGAETIDGEDTAVIRGDYESITLYSDGSNWFII